MSEPRFNHPLGSLPAEDLELVTQLVLKSGSLKDLATHYGVSYPTLRLRLDRLIERLRAAVDGRPRDPMADFLADLVERGELTPRAARAIRDEHRRLRDAPVNHQPPSQAPPP